MYPVGGRRSTRGEYASIFGRKTRHHRKLLANTHRCSWPMSRYCSRHTAPNVADFFTLLDSALFVVYTVSPKNKLHATDQQSDALCNRPHATQTLLYIQSIPPVSEKFNRRKIDEAIQQPRPTPQAMHVHHDALCPMLEMGLPLKLSKVINSSSKRLRQLQLHEIGLLRGGN